MANRRKGEEDFTDEEVQILDWTDEWHSSPDDGVGLVDFIAAKLGVSYNEAGSRIYGPHWKDGAFL